MVVFEIGSRSLTEESFKHVVETEIEKLVKFFGEENRDKIEDTIYNTIYVIGDRKKIDSKEKILESLQSFLCAADADFVFDLLKLRNYNEDNFFNFFNKFQEWAQSTPNIEENAEYRAFCASYFEKSDEKEIVTCQGKHEHFLEMRANFNKPEFIENLQKRVDDFQKFSIIIKAISKVWEDVKQECELLKQNHVSEYNQQLKWYLGTKQTICRQELAHVFGEDRLGNISITHENDDISKTFINYITKNPDFISLDDKIEFDVMFKQITGEDLTLQEYETKYEKQIKQLRETLHSKFEKIDKEKTSGLVKSTLLRLQEYLKEQGVKDVDKILDRFLIYMKKLDGSAAYYKTLKTENDNIDFIALPRDFQFSLTHETLHSIAKVENSNQTGFDNCRATIALNEVLTEFLALKIDERKAENLNSKLTCCYSSAFPIMEEFLNKNLDKIKAFYLKGDIESFKKFIGEENFEQLCSSLTQLLNLSEKISSLTLKTEQILKDSSSCKNDKLIEVVNKVQDVMQKIENYVAENDRSNVSLLLNLKLN